MKLPRIEKKIRVALQWTLDAMFERDIAQYINPRDIESVNRLLETARRPDEVGSTEDSTGQSQRIRSERIA